MRAGVVPPALRAAPFHFVVTASTSAIPDILLYRDQEKKTFSCSINTSKGQTSSLSFSSQTPIDHRHLLVSHLPPSLWTELLYIFQKYTSPNKSFTFSSPGFSLVEEKEETEEKEKKKETRDVVKDEKKKTTGNNPCLSGDERGMYNGICFHVLERRKGDFVPNNMVYNTLQQAAFSPFPVRLSDTSVNPPPHSSSSSSSGNTMINNSNHYHPPSFQPTSERFFEFLRRVQEGKLEKNEEDFHSVFSSSVGSSSSILQKTEDKEEMREKESCSTGGGGGRESSGVCEGSEGRGNDSCLPSVKGTLSETSSPCVSPIEVHSLSGSAEAEQCTAHNQRTLKEDFSSAASSSSFSSSSSSTFFFFFPHRVVVEECIPYHSPHFAVLVNLKPIVPYHLMIVPIRCVGSLQGLQEEERVDFGKVIALSIRVLNKVRRRRQDEAWKKRGESVKIGKGNEEGSGVGEKNKGRGMPATTTTTTTTTTTSSCSRLLDIENYAVAVQQGKEAGQTVAHLHFHLIPFDSSGVLTATPEADEEEQRRRPPRTGEMMKEETIMLRSIFEELRQE